MTAMDRRQRKTRLAIYNAFRELLEEKRYENITVQDIIDKADVGRSTFYCHFETKDFLLKALCEDIFEHIFKGDICNYPGKTLNLQQSLAHILWHLKEHKSDIMGLLSCESAEIFMKYIKAYLEAFFLMYQKQLRKDIPLDFLLNHLTEGFCAVIRWCVAKKTDISPEDTAEYYMSVISSCLTQKTDQ